MPCLVTATGGRIELELNRYYVIGRSPECDVVVEDGMASRSHARLGLGAVASTMFIEELGSRNGTFVNEKPIKGRKKLKHGNRIRIGATVFLVSLANVDLEAQAGLLDTGTIAAEHLLMPDGIGEEIVRVAGTYGGGAADFAGHIGSFSMIEVMQTIVHTHRNGTLHVVTDEGDAQVEFRSGEFCAARYRGETGFEALLDLARCKAGVFWLLEEHNPCLENIDQPASTVLFNLCRSLDEERRPA